MNNGYKLIENRWKDKVDSQGTPYMWHIDMGSLWLVESNASIATLDAWNVHPLVQDFKDLEKNKSIVFLFISGMSSMLVTEYRHQANWYSTHSTLTTKPRKNLLPEIKLMLQADKLQNKWNLERNRKSHKNYDGLIEYFDNWFKALDITESMVEDAYKMFDKLATTYKLNRNSSHGE